LGLAGLTLAGEPDVFQNYFDDTIKEVDIPLDAAIKACLQNGNTFADKVKKAYADCFGSADYDFGDLAAKEGSKDSDNDGLPDSFENNEQCFYKKMGWVNGAGDLNPDAIKGDLTGLESGTKSEFDGNIDKCAGWNGDFGSRRKREAGETETEEEVSNVPSVMESGSSALGWLKAAVRKTRNAEPGKRGKRNGKKGNGNKAKKQGGKGKGKGKGRKGRKRNPKKSGKGRSQKKRKRGRKAKKGGKGRSQKKRKRGRKAKKGGKGRSQKKRKRGRKAKKGGKGRSQKKRKRGRKAKKGGKGRSQKKRKRGRKAKKGGKGSNGNPKGKKKGGRRRGRKAKNGAKGSKGKGKGKKKGGQRKKGKRNNNQGKKTKKDKESK